MNNARIVPLLALLAALTGCDGARQELQRRQELDKILGQALLDLETKVAAHAEWQLDKIEDWGFRPGSNELVFGRRDGGRLLCRAQVIGTLNTADHTWMWAWNSDEFDPARTEHARRVRDFGQEHRYPRLTEGLLTYCDEDEAWALAALAVDLNDAQLAYAAPKDGILIFMTIDEVKVEDGRW